MRFGPTKTKFERKQEKRARLTNWHKHFALLPVFVPGVGYVWLEEVERKFSGGIWGAERKLIPEYRLPSKER